MSPRIRFEPIGEEIDCDEEEALLDAAFRHGYNLVYGCREGQCSACKAYLLEGEVFLKPYSTFALSDAEQEQGYTLLCRAMPEEDLVVELLHYDPDDYRLAIPICDGLARVDTLERLSRDIYRLKLVVSEPADFSFLPGQYVDVEVPGGEHGHRAYSIANLPGEGAIELLVRRYEAGRFSGGLGNGIAPGTQLAFRGPYGAFHLRESERAVLMIAGGSGMGPMLSLLRELARRRSERCVRFFYGARAPEDLICVEEVDHAGRDLADFRFQAVFSDTDRFVHEAVEEYLSAGEIGDYEAYMCGPPPMIEAAEEMLAAHGCEPDLIFWDKFTTSAEAEVMR